MTTKPKDKPRCKICGTEYDTLDEAMKCIESCKQKEKLNRLPALIENMDWGRSQLEVMWKTVAIDTTPEEFAYFLNVAEAAGLNPFLREIYCWKSKSGKLTIMTGRDGYLKTAKKDPTFKGLHSMEVCANDSFEMAYVDGAMKVKKHEILNFNDRGCIIGAWAKAEFDGQSPIVAYASTSEYKQSNKDVWNRTESAMMRKVPESMVLKRGAGISGLVTQEEIEVPMDVSTALESGVVSDGVYAEVVEPETPKKDVPKTAKPVVPVLDTSALHEFPSGRTTMAVTYPSKLADYVISDDMAIMVKQFDDAGTHYDVNGSDVWVLDGKYYSSAKGFHNPPKCVHVAVVAAIKKFGIDAVQKAYPKVRMFGDD